MPSTTFYNLKYSKQKELLHSAMVLFAENDYDDLSVRSLSKEMGITTGAFYRYFGSKEEFYIFMSDYTLEQFWIIQKRYMAELGRYVDVQEVLERDQLQSDFWKRFHQSSLDIRMKYYFRTKGNPLFQHKLGVVSRLENAEAYTAEEKEVTAFAVSVLQYIITSYKHLEHKEFDTDEMFQVINDMLFKGFAMGKTEAGNVPVNQPLPISDNFKE